jgi:hypothetical protein
VFSGAAVLRGGLTVSLDPPWLNHGDAVALWRKAHLATFSHEASDNSMFRLELSPSFDVE